MTPSPWAATCRPRSVPACTSAEITNRAPPASRTYDDTSRLPVSGPRPAVPPGGAHDPPPPRLEDVRRHVAAARLGAAVRRRGHPERGGVVVRGLPRVADREVHEVDAFDREVICHGQTLPRNGTS